MFKVKRAENTVEIETATVSHFGYTNDPLINQELNYDNIQQFQSNLSVVALPPDRFISLTFNYRPKDGNGENLCLLMASQDGNSVCIYPKGSPLYWIENDCKSELIDLTNNIKRLNEAMHICRMNNYLSNEYLINHTKELLLNFATMTRELARVTQDNDPYFLNKVIKTFALEAGNFELLAELKNSNPVKPRSP